MVKITIVNTIFSRTIFGNKRVVMGKSVISGGASGGDVVTGLDYVESFIPTISGASQQGCSVNETLPLSSGNVTIVVETADSTVYWEAKGR